MNNVRDIGRKINSLKNMQKVTSAMNLISSIKLRKYLAMQGASDKFLKETELMKLQILACVQDCPHPVVNGYADIHKTHVILFSADKGLCGTHNSSILKAVDVFFQKRQAKGIDVEFTCLGNKAYAHARHQGWEIVRHESMHEKALTPSVLKATADDIYARFLSAAIQDVWIFGKLFRSTLQQDTEIRQVLPLVLTGDDDDQTIAIDAEPSGDKLAQAYGGIYLEDIMRGFLIQSYLSEHSSRLTAMENATRNSEDMINKYISIQNHARQASVTNELIEIVSGKEALRG